MVGLERYTSLPSGGILTPNQIVVWFNAVFVENVSLKFQLSEVLQALNLKLWCFIGINTGKMNWEILADLWIFVKIHILYKSTTLSLLSTGDDHWECVRDIAEYLCPYHPEPLSIWQQSPRITEACMQKQIHNKPWKHYTDLKRPRPWFPNNKIL